MPLQDLLMVSPLPPQQNGIADYTYHLLQPLRALFNCLAVSTDPLANVPTGVGVVDHLQAFRYVGPDSVWLHQIGNNPGHIFVLSLLRRWGGITTLHDQNLHYLYETANTDKMHLLRLMTATSPKMGSAYGRHWAERGLKTAANYALFDMLYEVLSLSSAVVVHSHFAKRRIAALYGTELSSRVAVVPHLALPFAPQNPLEIRQRLNLPVDLPVIVTAGFATAAKRFDWLTEALDEVRRTGTAFFWVHAGREQAEEYDLSGQIKRFPELGECVRITGYLDEEDLNAYISACDILINLRFPSVGESSGTLARAMNAGKCCVVSDTAAYADLPRDAVAHISVALAVPQLVETLQALLTDPGRRAEIGSAAQRLAEGDWSPDSVAAAYKAIIEQTAKIRPPSPALPRAIRVPLTADTTPKDVGRALGTRPGGIEIVFEVASTEQLAALSLETPKLLSSVLPPNFYTDWLSFGREAAQAVVTSEAECVVIRVKGTLL